MKLFARNLAAASLACLFLTACAFNSSVPAPVIPTPPHPPPYSAYSVTSVTPTLLLPGKAEMPASLYMYLLFDQYSDQHVAFAALKSLVCTSRMPLTLATTLSFSSAPVFIPVKARASLRANPSTREVRTFLSRAYDVDGAATVMRRLSLHMHKVYLVAALFPLPRVPDRAALTQTPGFRAVGLDVQPIYVGAAINSAMREAMDGTIFNGPTLADRGYVGVSFLTGFGDTLLAFVRPNSAQAAGSNLALIDKGICDDQ